MIFKKALAQLVLLAIIKVLQIRIRVFLSLWENRKLSRLPKVQHMPLLPEKIRT